MAGVELVVGGWFASAVIGKLVDKVRSYFGDRFDEHKGMGDLLTRLEAAVPQIQAVIDMAGRRRISNVGLAAWLGQIKEAAYDADDVLDMFEYKCLADRVKGKSKVRVFASSSSSTAGNLFFPNSDIHELKKIIEKLDRIAGNVGNFLELIKLDYSTEKSVPTVRHETSSLDSGDQVFGREAEVETILDILLAGHGDEPGTSAKGGGVKNYIPDLGLRVLPIVGIGGVGKTTLARVIYNHPSIVEHFQLRSWVHVSDDSDVTKLTIQMLQSTQPLLDGISNVTNPTLEFVQREAISKLRNRRFLLVLDDVWDRSFGIWFDLQTSLNSVAGGSAVLVTTQSPTVAGMMGTLVPITLRVLNDEVYWKLFHHYAFGNKRPAEQEMQKLEQIGKEISQKLQGLPLAAKVVGRLLQSRLNLGYWNEISRSKWWEKKDIFDSIMPSLALSYDHLNACLKQCFAYCSIFPNNYVFQKERLVQMWIAQGFIPPKHSVDRTRLEDIAGEGFDELTYRSFFEPTWNNGYVMHDLMRELALCVSSDECSVLRDGSERIPETIRHLTIRTDNLALIGDVNKYKNLRTLLFFGAYHKVYLFPQLEKIFRTVKSLRVLDLSYCPIGRLPHAIGELRHLRYLDLSSTDVQFLPTTLCELFHLQVLNLRWCKLRLFPADINNLINLRHLYAETTIVASICGIGKLTHLQELKEFHVARKEGFYIWELRQMRELRGQLAICNLDNVTKEEALKAELNNKEHLDSLKFEWRRPEQWIRMRIVDAETLEGLQPHPNLNSLGIKWYNGVKPPIWMEENHLLKNLVSLSLIDCRRWKVLPALGQLPSLRVLIIEGMDAIKHIGAELYGGPDVMVFPSLEELVFENMQRWEEWSGVEQPQRLFPRLLRLQLVNCPRLVKYVQHCLPPSLVELTIKDCFKLINIFDEHPQNLTALSTLEMSSCLHLKSVPLLHLRELKVLRLSHCLNLICLEGDGADAPLKYLKIKECPRMKIFTHGETFCLPSLTELHIDHPILHIGHFRTTSLPSLEHLSIEDCFELNDLPEDLVTQPFLKKLQIESCPWIRSLPEYLSNLQSLEVFSIARCQLLESLRGLPPSLKELHILKCPVLRERCRKDQGPDWPMIAHVPYIRIDGETVQMTLGP